MSSILLNGDTSGTLTLTVPAVAGTNTITLPAATGTIITTASTSGIPNTINWTTVQTSSVNPAVAGTGYPMNTTSGALTVTLPASPTAGQMISILDYAGTFATNNLTINPNGNNINNKTTSAVLSTNREAINLVYVDSTQGWLAYSDVYSTTTPLPQPYTASYLVVAGGGGGGQSGVNQGGGGGGAGGYLAGTLSLTPGTVYTATVGGGGASNTNGSNSTFPGVTTAVGGGQGGYGPDIAGTAGGSGGGAGTGGTPGGQPGGSGTPGQGNAGGANNGLSTYSGGGGGGAGAVGGAGGSLGLGNGGNGSASSITGASVTYGGGGGSGKHVSAPAAGTGGTGGGGNGGNSSVGSNGTANLGSGAGGGSNGNNGGAGGSGVVIISVPSANYTATVTGSPTVTTSGSNTIIKWTSVGSGTYTA